MSTPTTDGLKQEIDAGRLRIGNEVQLSSGLPAYTGVTQLSVNASSQLQGTVPATIVQPTITDELFNLTGTPNGNIMTRTFVADASATTATAKGWMRIYITSSNDAILSTGAYYVPFVTLT